MNETDEANKICHDKKMEVTHKIEFSGEKTHVCSCHNPLIIEFILHVPIRDKLLWETFPMYV